MSRNKFCEFECLRNKIFTEFTDNLLGGLVVHNSKTEIIYHNLTALEILELSEDELLGVKPVDSKWKMIHSDGSEFKIDENPAIVVLNTSQSITNVIMGIQSGRDKLKWIIINAKPIYLEDELHAIVTFVDVTEYHNNKLLTETVLGSSQIGIWKYYLKDDILVWDESMFKVYEVDPDTFTSVYEEWESILHPDDKEKGSEEVEKCIRGEKELDTIFRIISPKTGSVRFIKARGKVLKDGKGEPYLLIGTNWDVTAEVEAEIYLQKAKEEAELFAKNKSNFIANMSHEIRTPLNGIIGMIDMILESDLDDDQKAMVSVVKNCGDNLSNILNDILDFSKMESGNIEINESNFDFVNLIHDIVSLFKASSIKRLIKIYVNIESDVPTIINTDQVRLRQLISNFINNAIKFSDAGHSIFVDISTSGINKLSISVRDEGIGMDETQIEKIFDDYVQGDSGISRRYGGTGLGLAICKKIADLMGGTIDVISEPGKGSEFKYTFPFKLSDEIDACNINIDSLNIDKSMKILIVEDNKVNQMVAVKMLNKAGYKYELAENGLEAINKCKTTKYSLILMDLQMPIMGGLEATKIILENDPTQIIIAMTANIFEDDKDACKEVGMKGFIGKPFTYKKFLEVMTAIN